MAFPEIPDEDSLLSITKSKNKKKLKEWSDKADSGEVVRIF